MTTWRWLTPEEREKRNEHILELWAMGYSRIEIAEKMDITAQRVSQIVNSFGAGWR
jgi:DNA-binding CsgD family transcriptional regulator